MGQRSGNVQGDDQILDEIGQCAADGAIEEGQYALANAEALEKARRSA